MSDRLAVASNQESRNQYFNRLTFGRYKNNAKNKNSAFISLAASPAGQARARLHRMRAWRPGGAIDCLLPSNTKGNHNQQVHKLNTAH